ncbi:NAD(+) synthase [Candidatus Woesearchaeota archaeon]|jgi:NAD+ synthetase|nr:NAD(+) synthase [Candidatus Woesearchaeota archaeon]MBT4110746.1 NAD(+) synthase [Candidatus Woesearchaeota archaeon]MBT4336342.1 NAD(+) synthase [Candidatus Woesearchaeota archaeon]MBT4469297.1 NAD(+) synthase [Candidatus Woesearchaeota archaeon]MBT6743880.1 NAD(+) synthase [Candidatus Woesearchaeota archaeon]
MTTLKELQKLSCNYIDNLIFYLYQFLDKQYNHYRQKGFLHGLSGGVDSATLLKLIVDRYGPESITCLITNLDDFSNPNDLNDAKELCDELGVKYHFINITKAVEALKKTFNGLNDCPKDNLASRIRIAIACELSVKHNLRLLFAGPYSEWAIKGGDIIGGATAHCYPFGGLYKSEVYAIAKKIGLPEKFIKKVTSNSSLEKENYKQVTNYGLKFSDVEKLLMFFNGLISEEKVAHIPNDKRVFFHYLLKVFEKDIDYPSLDRDEPERFGRKEFFAQFDKFPFET